MRKVVAVVPMLKTATPNTPHPDVWAHMIYCDDGSIWTHDLAKETVTRRKVIVPEVD